MTSLHFWLAMLGAALAVFGALEVAGCRNATRKRSIRNADRPD